MSSAFCDAWALKNLLEHANFMDREPLLIRDVALTGEEDHCKQLATMLKIPPEKILRYEILKRSVDRRARPIRMRLNIALWLDDESLEGHLLKRLPPPTFKARRHATGEGTPRAPRTPAGSTLIVGTGPAGLTAAWALALEGRTVTLLERGEAVEERLTSVGHFWAAKGTVVIE